MQCTLVNQTNSLLIVTLSSGVSVYLGPGQKSAPVDAMEISGNPKVEKLRQRGMLSVEGGSN